MTGKNKWQIIIVVILIIALGFYLLRPVLFETKKITPKSSPNTITMEPQFSKEGTMVFRSAENDTLHVVDIEIADNDQERTQGMMYRTKMPFNQAMLFIMEYEREQSFWMRNTKMSLDIMYVNGEFEIVTIYKHTQPYSESPIPSFKRAKYVVETAAGFCDAYKISEGHFIEFKRD